MILESLSLLQYFTSTPVLQSCLSKASLREGRLSGRPLSNHRRIEADMIKKDGCAKKSKQLVGFTQRIPGRSE